MCVWNDSTRSKIHNPVTCPSEFSHAIVLSASTCHDGGGLAFQEEGRATCTEDCEVQSRVIAPTMLPCSTSTLVQNKSIDSPDRPNSTVGETCLAGCAPGPGLASGDNFRALPCVSENDNMTFLTRYSPAGHTTRCVTSTNPAPIGACEDWGEIPYGSQVDWLVSSESTDHTSDSDDPAEHNMWNPMLELFCHAEIGILMEALADEMVLAMIALSCHFALDILCDKSETRKCVDAATFDLSQDGTDVTSDEQCNTMGAVRYTGGASTLSRALEVVGSVSLIGSLPNCSVVSSAADGFPSVVSCDRDRIVLLESCHSSCSDGDASVDVTSSVWSCGSNGFLVGDTP